MAESNNTSNPQQVLKNTINASSSRKDGVENFSEKRREECAPKRKTVLAKPASVHDANDGDAVAAKSDAVNRAETNTSPKQAVFDLEDWSDDLDGDGEITAERRKPTRVDNEIPASLRDANEKPASHSGASNVGEASHMGAFEIERRIASRRIERRRGVAYGRIEIERRIASRRIERRRGVAYGRVEVERRIASRRIERRRGVAYGRIEIERRFESSIESQLVRAGRCKSPAETASSHAGGRRKYRSEPSFAHSRRCQSAANSRSAGIQRRQSCAESSFV